MNLEKPHRTSQVTTFSSELEEPFIDRRLSDLLPSEFIRQVGLDPDQYIFATSNQAKMRRRATDPGLTSPDAALSTYRRASQADYSGNVTPPNPTSIGSPLCLQQGQQMVSCFLVELADVTVDAFSCQALTAHDSDGVIVRDGCYLRFGRIIRKINPESCDQSALQIIMMDVNGEVGDYINGQTQIAKELLPSFILQCGARCKFVSVETVSYQARSLIRVKVTNADDPNLDLVVQKLMMVFCSPVEIYD